MLLGSAFANMGASASVVTAHSVAGAAVGEGKANRIVGKGVVAGVGEGDGLRPYTLQDVVTLRPGLAGLLAEIQVLGSLFPEKGVKIPRSIWRLVINSHLESWQ